jgi:hypothetical protein
MGVSERCEHVAVPRNIARNHARTWEGDQNWYLLGGSIFRRFGGGGGGGADAGEVGSDPSAAMTCRFGSRLLAVAGIVAQFFLGP